MYYSTRQYPELRALSSAEQSVVVKQALSEHDPSQWKRFALALGVAIAAGYFIDYAVQRIGFNSTVLEYAGMVSTGLFFYAYLLWEINTRTHAAVAKHFGQVGRGH